MDLIDSCLCRLRYKDKVEWFYNFFIEIFQTIIQFEIVGIGLFLINGYKSNITPKIGLIYIIIYLTHILTSGSITIIMIK